MVKAAREKGRTSVAADCLLSLTGIADPTPEQTAALQLVALFFQDTHLLARVHTKDG